MVYRLLMIGFIATVGIGVLFVATNPENVPAVVFIVLFLLLYALFYAALGLVILVLRRLDIISWTTRRIRRTALAVACVPVFLLILQSIGQLAIKDVVLTVGLFVLLYLYFNRTFIRST